MGRRTASAGLGLRARLAVLSGLAVFTVAVYVLVVLAGGVLLGSPDRPHLWLSVLATAIVALGAESVRGRLQAAVRGPAAVSPYDVLRRFSDDVTGAGTATDVPVRMARALAEGVDAAWAQVWLSVDDRLVLEGTWPPDAPADAAAPRAGRPDASPEGRRQRTVRSGGRVYGVLRLQERPGSPLTSMEERLVDGLAAQSGPVLRLIGLQSELAARHRLLQQQQLQLLQSRARLVAAQDEERRRLERDMHDGAQQHLVALSVNLRLAQTVAARDPERAAAVLGDQAEAARAALHTVEALSRGISPALLTSHGLGPALREACRGSRPPVDVTVAPGAVPVPAFAEATLYFVVLEAVQNAGKHAGAGEITVRLSLTAELAEAVVQDDGVGFDPALDRGDDGGTGLANMRERLDAVGGRLAITSSPRRGTRVTAGVPLRLPGQLPRPRAGD